MPINQRLDGWGDRNLFILRNLLIIMPTTYLDNDAENALEEIISHVQKEHKIKINRSQAVVYLMDFWRETLNGN